MIIPASRRATGFGATANAANDSWKTTFMGNETSKRSRTAATDALSSDAIVSSGIG